MFLLQLLIVSIIHLAMIGLDVLSFFVVIRMLALRWPKAPLLALDQVGKPVTDPLIASVGRAIPSSWTSSSERRKLVVAAVALLGLALCRLGLAGLLAAWSPNLSGNGVVFRTLDARNTWGNACAPAAIPLAREGAKMPNVGGVDSAQEPAVMPGATRIASTCSRHDVGAGQGRRAPLGESRRLPRRREPGPTDVHEGAVLEPERVAQGAGLVGEHGRPKDAVGAALPRQNARWDRSRF